MADSWHHLEATNRDVRANLVHHPESDRLCNFKKGKPANETDFVPNEIILMLSRTRWWSGLLISGPRAASLTNRGKSVVKKPWA